MRMAVAGARKGWLVEVAHDAAEIEAFAPDLVVSLHHQAPKATPFPTLGCLWNPTVHFEDDAQALARVLSYDGFLTAGPAMRRFVQANFFPVYKPVITAPIYPSTHALALPPRVGPESRLFYVGSNWDGLRFERLFKHLAAADVIAAYGPARRWQYLAHAYAGTLPFDGQSTIAAANQCGIGLCLHLPGHVASGLPNMRVFELAAAGALIVCGRHPFIDTHFGDSVLSIDADAAEDAVADQIINCVRWARTNIDEARAKAVRAQTIFNERFTLDGLMDAWPRVLADIRRNCGFQAAKDAEDEAVEFVLLAHGACTDALDRTIASIVAQSHRPIGLIVVGMCPGLDAALARAAAASCEVRVVPAPRAECPSTALWSGLRAVGAPWFGVIEAGDILFPNHASILLRTARESGTEMVFAMAAREEGKATSVVPTRGPRRGEAPGDYGDFPPSAVLARSRCLSERLLRDPELAHASSLFLIRRLAATSDPVPTWLISLRVGSAGLVKMDPAARADLERLERLDPGRPGGWATGPRPRLAPPGDLGHALLDRVPLLHDVSDFAALDRTRPVLIYGSSRGGRLVHLELLKHEGIKISGFLDSARSGSAWDLPVRAITEISIADLAAASIIVASQHVLDIMRILKQLGDFNVYNAYPYIQRYVRRE